MNNQTEELIRKYNVIGSRRFSNYFWSIILLIGGNGFLITGLSSYFKINFLLFLNSNSINFLPQGIIMTFYGVVAISLSFYIFLTILWDIGGGYNEFNKNDQLIRIVRNGFPGKNRKIFLIYSISNVKSIKLNIQDGINPKRNIYLYTKDNRQIPLTSVEQPKSLFELENEAADLAKFLNVRLEGLID
jgi:hypothetical protein